MEKVKKQELESLFVGYDQALALKELGFDEPCIGLWDIEKVYYGGLYLKSDGVRFNTNTGWKNTHYPKNVAAPLYQQAFRWFRKNHWLYVDIFVDDNKTFGFMVTHFTSEGRIDSPAKYNFITYEEAEQACLDKLIEICKNDNTSN